ncbi:MAG: sigma 54-interacting transcriptional regulator [Polyangiaceae bacterium]
MERRAQDEGERTAELRATTVSRPAIRAHWEDGGGLTAPMPDSKTCVIGRGDDVDIVIDHPTISRRHAVLHRDGGLYVEDLGSSNGTKFRGKAIPSGERVAVGWNEPILLGAVMLMVVPGGIPAGTANEKTPPVDPRRTAMDDVARLVSLVAPTDMSVLLLGETGAGKGFFARQIHERSKRASAPWLHLNCAALPENLLESELFGYERGAFSGAAQAKPGLLENASGGTVFLDEIGEMPPAIQAKLLLAIERREVTRLGALKARAFNVRFISATNKELDGITSGAATAGSSFRADLYFRLAGLPITIPPLRERLDELPSLVGRLLAEAATKAGRAEPAITVAAMKAIKAYAWPGNVRELATVLERALLWCGDTLDEQHVVTGPAGRPKPPRPPSDPPPSQRATPIAAAPVHAPAIPPAAPSQPRVPRPLAREVEELERRGIIDALEACGGNQSRAAEMLGIARRTLISRMIAFGLPRPRKG